MREEERKSMRDSRITNFFNFFSVGRGKGRGRGERKRGGEGGEKEEKL